MPIMKGPAAWEAQKRREEEANRKRHEREKERERLAGVKRSHPAQHEKRTWTNQGLNYYNLKLRKQNEQ